MPEGEGGSPLTKFNVGTHSSGQPVTGPSAWYGKDMAASSEWIHVLSETEVAEIDAALAKWRATGRDLQEMTQADFVVPTLAVALANILRELTAGRGFILIRGIPVERYDPWQKTAAYWGIGTHLGWAVSQNGFGHLLGHVLDVGDDPLNPITRIYRTRARQLFHTDSSDIVGLLCVNIAKQGGRSSISSSMTCYNELLKTRPDLLKVLMEPFYYDRKGEVPEDKLPYYELAIFYEYAGYLTTTYSKDFITACQDRHPDVPRLTAQQIEALNMLDSLAERADIRLDMDLIPGDIQFLHNHQIFHARKPYEDYEDPARRRLLLRLWLSVKNGRPLPPAFEERYGNIDPSKPRGGIMVPGVPDTLPLSPY